MTSYPSLALTDCTLHLITPSPTEPSIALLTINRPSVKNAFRPETVEDMIKAVRTIELDSNVGVLLLRGSGESWSSKQTAKTNVTDITPN